MLFRSVSDLDANEPEELAINAIYGKKTSGKRAVDMKDFLLSGSIII